MNFKQARCQLFKGTLFAAGIGLGIGGLYTISNVYQKGKTYYADHQSEKQFEEYIKTDSRFANGIELTKFSITMHNNYEPKENTK